MSPVLGIIASSNQQGRGGGPIGAYDALAYVISPAATSVTFSGIPAGYEYLQIRGMANNGETSGWNNQGLRFNNDTSNSYAIHSLYATGSGNAASGAQTASSSMNDAFRIPPASSNTFGAFVMDIYNYNSPTSNTVIRTMTGGSINGSGGWAGLHSGGYFKTDVITSITLLSSVGNFGTGSTFALYGVK